MTEKLADDMKRFIGKGETVKLDDLEITCFEVPHDSTDNVGYSIKICDKIFTFITDIGHITPTVAKFVSISDYLVMEANYDKSMLDTGPYPTHLKERIASGNGHLCNKELAEDIFQETFVKAIVMIRQGRYEENGKFKAWIMRIAHNLIIDSYRQERAENTISNDEADVDLLNSAKLCDETIEDILVRQQVLSDVKKLVRHLPENQREVLVMRYYQDLSFKEIADITGVSINTALGRMRYAILNMRRMAEENKMALSMA